MKYLAPLSRDKREACERIVQHLDFGCEPAVTEREVGRLASIGAAVRLSCARGPNATTLVSSHGRGDVSRSQE